MIPAFVLAVGAYALAPYAGAAYARRAIRHSFGPWHLLR